MSTTTDPSPAELELQRIRATIDESFATTDKLRAEAKKFQAEQAKLSAEQTKLALETRWYPYIPMGVSLTALVIALLSYFKH